MQQLDIRMVKNDFPRLIDDAAMGRSFAFAKSGKPMVNVIPEYSKPSVVKRVGFLKGQISAPSDFDKFGSNEITAMFEN
jgi:antitoxin (DNA-binding transcriptional repressor) of toxin-antitoxin stability system